MIHSNATRQGAVHLRVLTDDQVQEIYHAALDILAATGCNVLHEGARRMLKGAGASVREERARVPRHAVQACVQSAPKCFTVYNRDGVRAMELEGRKSYYGTSTASPKTRDPFSGEIRETRIADIALGALLADALPHIDYVMPMGSAQDVPALAADACEFEAVVTNTSKPVVFIAYSPAGAQRVYEMAAEVAGGLQNLQERPFLLSYPEPISPLVYPAEVVDRIFVSADLCLPQIFGPAIQLGATGPVTLAGAIAQGLAESLMGLVLAQLRRPGTPCVLGVNLAVFDMTTANMSTAAPEMSLGLAGQAEVAQALGLPTWGLAGATDSKLLDAQAGIESTFGILAQGLAGLNLIHDVGYMDMAMVCSPEMLVLGNEVIGMTKRFVRGIEVSPETLARDVVDRVGPGGHYLMEDHTVKNFRQELWSPKLLTRQEYRNWQTAGSKDMPQRIRDWIVAIRDSHQPPALPDKVRASWRRLREEATRG
jgi:trimethylamine---corrinoid protein Co-methyltransferase